MLVRSCCYWCDLVKAAAASFLALLESSSDLSLVTHVKRSSLASVPQLRSQNKSNNNNNKAKKNGASASLRLQVVAARANAFYFFFFFPFSTALHEVMF